MKNNSTENPTSGTCNPNPCETFQTCCNGACYNTPCPYCCADGTCSNSTCTTPCPSDQKCGVNGCCLKEDCCNNTSCTADSTSNRCCPDGQWVSNETCCSDNSCPTGQTCNTNTHTCSNLCPSDQTCGVSGCCSKEDCCNNTSCTTDSTSNRCCPDGQWVPNETCCSDNSCPNGERCNTNTHTCSGSCPADQKCGVSGCCLKEDCCNNTSCTTDSTSNRCCPDGNWIQTDACCADKSCPNDTTCCGSMCCPKDHLCDTSSNPNTCGPCPGALCNGTCCPPDQHCTTDGKCEPCPLDKGFAITGGWCFPICPPAGTTISSWCACPQVDVKVNGYGMCPDSTWCNNFPGLGDGKCYSPSQCSKYETGYICCPPPQILNSSTGECFTCPEGQLCDKTCCPTCQKCDTSTNTCVDLCNSSEFCCTGMIANNATPTCCVSEGNCNYDGTCLTPCPAVLESGDQCCPSADPNDYMLENSICPVSTISSPTECCLDGIGNGTCCTDGDVCTTLNPYSKPVSGSNINFPAKCCPPCSTISCANIDSGYHTCTCIANCSSSQSCCIDKSTGKTDCCESGQTCCNGTCQTSCNYCCSSNPNSTNNYGCCSTECCGTTCCEETESCCGTTCCQANEICDSVNSTCITCPEIQLCGSVCCPSDQICGDATTGNCIACPEAQSCGDTCCAIDHLCDTSTNPNSCIPCPGALCDGTCCPSDQLCSDGKCVACPDTGYAITDGWCFPICPPAGTAHNSWCSCLDGNSTPTSTCEAGDWCNNFAGKAGDGKCYDSSQCHQYGTAYICCENETNTINTDTGLCEQTCPNTGTCNSPADGCVWDECCTNVTINGTTNCCPYGWSSYWDIKTNGAQCCPATTSNPGLAVLCPGSGKKYGEHSICCSTPAPANDIPVLSCMTAGDGMPYCAGVGSDCSEFPCADPNGINPSTTICSADQNGGPTQICCPPNSSDSTNYANVGGVCVDVNQCVGNAEIKCNPNCIYPDCCVSCLDIGTPWACYSECDAPANSDSCSYGDHCPIKP